MTTSHHHSVAAERPHRTPILILARARFFLLWTVCVCGPVRFACGEEITFSQALSGISYPLAIQLKQATAEWRRISVHASAGVNGNVSVNVSGTASGSTSQNNLTGAISGTQDYVTKGQTVSIGGRTYLVAYHLPAIGLDLGMLLKAAATKAPPTALALSADSTVPLSLLDTGSIGTIDDVRAFDLPAEIASSEKAIRALADLIKSQSPDPKKAEPAK
jgi:hypothetical protein